jgi:hypothetical protein
MHVRTRKDLDKTYKFPKSLLRSGRSPTSFSRYANFVLTGVDVDEDGKINHPVAHGEASRREVLHAALEMLAGELPDIARVTLKYP